MSKWEWDEGEGLPLNEVLTGPRPAGVKSGLVAHELIPERELMEQLARLEAKLDALVAGLKARGSL